MLVPRRDVTSLTGPEFRNDSCSLLLLGRYGGRVTGGFDRLCGQSVWLTRWHAADSRREARESQPTTAHTHL